MTSNCSVPPKETIANIHYSVLQERIIELKENTKIKLVRIK